MAEVIRADRVDHGELDPVPVAGNILVVMLDDIGIEVLSAYGLGLDPAPTPHIDRLASEGVIFDAAYSNPVCSPTRATVQTGRYSFRTGIGGIVTDDPDDFGLQLTETILPRMLDLGQSGYSHAAFGKWHLSNISSGGYSAPNLLGYQYFAGNEGNFGNGPYSYFHWRKIVNGDRFIVDAYATTVTVDDAIAWIATAPTPWFVYLAFNASHTPLHAPPSNLHHFNLPHSEPEPGEDPRPYFLAMTEALDTELGRLLAAVGRSTTVILVGDNGSFGLVIAPPFDPQHDKGTVYEGGVRTPLIVRSPLVAAPGSRVGAIVNTSDLFATVAQLARVNLGSLSLPTIDSISLVPYLRDPQRSARRLHAYSEKFDPNGLGDPASFDRAIRNRRFKLIRRTVAPQEEFYDLIDDPFEHAPLDTGSLNPVQQQGYDSLSEALLALLGS